MQTITNIPLLQFWISQNGKQAKVKLSYETGISYDTLGRILRGDREATKTEQIAICKVTKLKKSELFISSDQEGNEKSA
ncbi:MAG: hypothetical protein AB7I27_00475 [Bacteriovoracaceae bacterium]